MRDSDRINVLCFSPQFAAHVHVPRINSGDPDKVKDAAENLLRVATMQHQQIEQLKQELRVATTAIGL